MLIAYLSNTGDQVVLQLPMKIGLTTWVKNHNSVSVNYGPLTFSLKIKEDYIKKEMRQEEESIDFLN